GAVDILIFEATDAIESRFAQPIEQDREVLLGFAGEADNEGRTDGEVRTHLTPALNALQGFFLMRWPPHRLQHARARVLKRNIEIRQYATVRHQRQDLVDLRIGIDIVQAHPGTE